MKSILKEREQQITIAIALLAVVVLTLAFVDIKQFRWESNKLKELQLKVDEMQKENNYHNIGQLTKFRQQPPQTDSDRPTLSELLKKETNQQSIKLSDVQQRGQPTNQEQQEQMVQAKVEQRIAENRIEMSPQLAIMMNQKKQLGGINQYQNEIGGEKYGIQGGEKPMTTSTKQDGFEQVTLVKPQKEMNKQSVQQQQQKTSDNNNNSPFTAERNRNQQQQQQTRQPHPTVGRSIEYQVRQQINPHYQPQPLPLLQREQSHPLYEDSVVHFSPTRTTTTSQFKGKVVQSGNPSSHSVAVKYSHPDGTSDVLDKRETVYAPPKTNSVVASDPHQASYSSKAGYVTALEYNHGGDRSRMKNKKTNDKYETMFQGKISVNAE